MNTWDRPLPIGKTDRYSVTVSDKWLDGETIASATVGSDDPSIISLIGPVTITEGNTISTLITGVAGGYGTVKFEYTTTSRSSCYEAIVHVTDEC